MARRRTPLPAPVYPPANIPVSRTLDAGYQRTMAGDDVRVSAAITAITSVTDLRASVLHLDQASVRLFGYYTAGDGGGGDLYWDANSTADDDGGVFFKPDSVMEAGRWRRDLSDGTYNVKFWGAKGDCDANPLGTQIGSDNSDAFEAAIAAMGPIPTDNPVPGWKNASWYGARLLIPPGDSDLQWGFKPYYLSRSLHIPRSVIVEGVGGTSGTPHQSFNLTRASLDSSWTFLILRLKKTMQDMLRVALSATSNSEVTMPFSHHSPLL